jgi:hypothetical protein
MNLGVAPRGAFGADTFHTDKFVKRIQTVTFVN